LSARRRESPGGGCSGCGGVGSAGGRILSVRRADDLRQLARSYGRYDAVHIEVGLGELQTRSWEEQLLARYSACGCDAGAVAVIAAIAALPVLALVVPAIRSPEGAVLVPIWILAAALIGKALGIAYSRLRLHLEVRELTRMLTEAQGPIGRSRFHAHYQPVGTRL